MPKILVNGKDYLIHYIIEKKMFQATNQSIIWISYGFPIRQVSPILAKTTSASVKTTAPPPSGQCSRSVRGCWPPPCLPATYPRKNQRQQTGGNPRTAD